MNGSSAPLLPVGTRVRVVQDVGRDLFVGRAGTVVHLREDAYLTLPYVVKLDDGPETLFAKTDVDVLIRLPLFDPEDPDSAVRA